MTTPAPEKTTGRRSRERAQGSRPVLILGALGWLLSWLVPTLFLGLILLGLSFVPGLDGEGYLAPLIPLIGGAAVLIGIPGTLLVNWLCRHQLNSVVHVLGYVVVGLLYGPVALFAGPGGLVPMLIPIIGFPAGVLLGAGRWMAQPLATVKDPAAHPAAGTPSAETPRAGSADEESAEDSQ